MSKDLCACRSQIYVNPLNAVDYLAVGANDTLYLTAACVPLLSPAPIFDAFRFQIRFFFKPLSAIC